MKNVVTKFVSGQRPDVQKGIIKIGEDAAKSILPKAQLQETLTREGALKIAAKGYESKFMPTGLASQESSGKVLDKIV